GAAPGAGSVPSRPPSGSMWAVFSGSGSRQSESGDASRISCAVGALAGFSSSGPCAMAGEAASRAASNTGIGRRGWVIAVLRLEAAAKIPRSAASGRHFEFGHAPAQGGRQPQVRSDRLQADGGEALAVETGGARLESFGVAVDA